MVILKINLDEPFQSRWRFGYLVTNSENRKNVVLFNSDDDRTTISYARYLLSVKLGRFLTDNEEADHVDDDKTNDSVSNLQILTPHENKIKQGIRRVVLRTFTCPSCSCEFTLTGKELGKRRNKTEPTCSISCGYKTLSLRTTN